MYQLKFKLFCLKKKRTERVLVNNDFVVESEKFTVSGLNPLTKTLKPYHEYIVW